MRSFGNKKAIHGKLVKLPNKDKKSVESAFYFAMWAEDASGKNERCFLFSQSDISKISDVKYCDFEKDMVLGRLYRIGNAKSYYIKIVDLEKNEKIVRLNSTVITNGTTRAKKNPEDIPEKAFLQNLID